MTHELALVLGTFFACVSFASLGVAIWAAHLAIQANIRLVGRENSTHAVQYVPMPAPKAGLGDDEFGFPQHDEVDQQVRRGERAAFEAAGDLDDETFSN